MRCNRCWRELDSVPPYCIAGEDFDVCPSCQSELEDESV